MTKSKSKSKKSDKGKEINNPSNASDSRVSEMHQIFVTNSLKPRRFKAAILDVIHVRVKEHMFCVRLIVD